MPRKEVEKATELSRTCDCFIIVGSTLIVQPAGLIPGYAKENGAFLGIVNLSDTPYDDVCDVLIRESAGDVLPKIVDVIEIEIQSEQV